MDPPEGVLGLNKEIQRKIIEIFFFRSTCFRCMKFGMASGAEGCIS